MRQRRQLRKESDIIELIGEGLISKDTARNKLQSIKKQIEGTEKEILNIKNNIEKEKEKEITQDHIEILKFLLENYDEETVNELKEILNLIIKKQLSKALITLTYSSKFRVGGKRWRTREESNP